MRVVVVGAGPFGCTVARQCLEAGHQVTVLDSREVIGGQTADDLHEGLLVCRYGAHIFHTNSERVWRWMSRFTAWTPYEHYVIAQRQGKIYSVPFSLRTLYEGYGITSPVALAALRARWSSQYPDPNNLEEWALHHLGPVLFEAIVKEYTEKFWQRPCRELPASILRRIPIRETFQDIYFTDVHQAMPTQGYTALFTRMLEGCAVVLNANFLDNRTYWERQADRIVYTGSVDALMGYAHGPLGYLTTKYESVWYPTPQQGCPVINWTGSDVPYSRTVEWCHLSPNVPVGKSLVTFEYPSHYEPRHSMPLYPIRSPDELSRHALYEKQAKDWPQYVLGGRLGTYQYYEMGQAVMAALECARTLLRS